MLPRLWRNAERKKEIKQENILCTALCGLKTLGTFFFNDLFETHTNVQYTEISQWFKVPVIKELKRSVSSFWKEGARGGDAFVWCSSEKGLINWLLSEKWGCGYSNWQKWTYQTFFLSLRYSGIILGVVLIGQDNLFESSLFTYYECRPPHPGDINFLLQQSLHVVIVLQYVYWCLYFWNSWILNFNIFRFCETLL